ncbi:MAG TPA: hypothetical protein VLE53_11325 [Gemmatimonadaceae bacterium]|nr:hypothetical protein [Gemmatimonadaceae bacterium]
MTETPGERGGPRLDLRALDVGENGPRTDAVMRAVLERITTRASRPEWAAWMARAQRGLAAVAAVLLLLAGTLVFAQRRRDTGVDLTATIETWALSSHVPTNGELLTTYQGYRR